MAITKLDQIIEAVKSKSKKRVVAAYANDSHTIEAVYEALHKGIIEATLVGCAETIEKQCAAMKIDSKLFRIVNEPDEQKAATKAVELIRNGEGDILMKGLVSTDKYMRAILNKEKGLLPEKAVLTHITIFEVPAYHKLLIASDVAIIPLPDLKTKIQQINFMINVAKKLDIQTPKVALVAAAEQVSDAMVASSEAALLSKMGERGQIKGALIEGPLGLDLAIDKESAQIKGLKSEVGGDADCILFPNIESANVFYKTCTKFGGAELAGLVFGAKVPCVLSSRGDSAQTKLYSIAFAALMA